MNERPTAPRDRRPASTRAAWLPWSLWGTALLLSLAGTVVLVASWDAPAPTGQFGPRGFGLLMGVVVGTVGAIVATRQPANAIGWLLCVAAVLGAVTGFAAEYVVWALVKHGGRAPLGVWALWIVEWMWIPIVAALGVVFAIFPNGRPISRQWGWAIAIGLVATAPGALAATLVPTFGTLPYPNPIGAGEAMVVLSDIGLLPFLFFLGTGAAALVARFRRSRGDERQQLKWLALAASWMAVSIAIFASVAIVQGSSEATGFDWAENLVVLSFFAIPVAIGIGVLKYRLYDIDVVINRAIVYGALGAFITLVYVAIVVGVGAAVGTRGDALLSAIAAAVVALAFQPARRWAQRLANRLVYGRRATPYEVLSELSTRFAETYSLEDALPRLARVTADAIGADRTRIWLGRDGVLHAAASWPDVDTGDTAHPIDGEPAHVDGDPAFPVRHQGELLGAVSVRMPPSEPLAAPQEKLVRDVAAHAGLVLRNVALVADLRASRQRIVSAQDERARKLERDLHDGAQQQLVALSVKLRLAEQLIATEPEKARVAVASVRADAGDALETLRDLSRGIYPPLLAEQGLAVALESQARKSPVAVRVEADGIGRYQQEIEATAYFCALEALQNVAKYANASHVSIRLGQRDGVLWFTVEDDGVGFDPEKARGSGLTNMRDRLEAVGGTLDVESRHGAGTTVTGRVPVRDREVLP